MRDRLAGLPAGIDRVLARRGALFAAKLILLAAGLWTAGRLVFAVLVDPIALGANPAETILRETGDATIRFLLIGLAVTPLRRLTGVNALIKFRRMLGLLAYFYGVLHLASYVGFDRFFIWAEIVKDIAKRPFITVGFAAFLLMTPLAVTSTRGWIRRLGAEAWNRLHRVVYAVAVLGMVHYWWLARRDLLTPAVYTALVAILLALRLLPRRSRSPLRVDRPAAS